MASMYVTGFVVEWTPHLRSSMQRSVSNRISITPTFGPDDRPRALSVLAVLVLFSITGYVLTRASLDEVHGGADVDTHEPATTREPGVESFPAAPVAHAPASVSAPAQVPEPAPEAPAPAATPASVGSLTRGRIAYIRCDGMETRGALNPCPRDAAVERTVWEAIERLPSCPALAGQRGSSDVRVVFDHGTVSGLGFRDIEPPILDRDAVRGCLEPALQGLRSTQPGARMTASFRFDVR